MLMAKRIREEFGMNQEEAARLLGIDRTVLSKIENEKYELSSVVLFKMARLYKIAPEKILGVNPADDRIKFEFRNAEKLDANAKDVFSKIEKIVKNLIFLESVSDE